MKGKIFVPLLLASVTASAFGAQATFSVRANDYTNTTNLETGATITTTGMIDNATVGDNITLPTVQFNGTDATDDQFDIVVLDPNQNKVEYTGTTFEVTKQGWYNVFVYDTRAGDVVKTEVQNYTIYVEGDEYSMQLPTNTKYVIPATVKKDTEVKVAVPTILNGDEELTSDQTLSNADGYTLKVSYINKDEVATETVLTIDTSNEFYAFTPSTSGIYEVIYRWEKSGTTYAIQRESFVVKDVYAQDDIDLRFKFDQGSKPTTATLGQELTFPQVTAYDHNNNDAAFDSAYVVITVTNPDGTEVTVEDFKFTPEQKGDYKVTYTVSLPIFGKTAATSVFFIENVIDNKNPEVFVTNSYTVNEDGDIEVIYVDADGDNAFTAGVDTVLFDRATTTLTGDELEEEITKQLSNLSYDIPSVVVLDNSGNATITIPAIMGTDNFSGYSDLKFVRDIRTPNSTITEIKNGADAYDAGQQATYTFTDAEAGEYTIRYSVTDADNNYRQVEYKVLVLESNEENKLKDDSNNWLTPTVTFPALSSSYVDYDGTLKITKPTVSDSYDTRLKSNVYYSLESTFDLNDADFDSKYFEITEEVDGKLELKIEDITGLDASGVDTIYVYAVAQNGYAQGDYTVVSRSVTAINDDPSKEQVAPGFNFTNETFVNGLTAANQALIDVNTGVVNATIDEFGFVTGTTAAFNQGDRIILPTVSTTADADSNLIFAVKVTDPNGNPVNVTNYNYRKSGTAGNFIYTLTNQNANSEAVGGFTASASGVYTVTYYAKDTAGNQISQTVGVRVNDNTVPTIDLLGAFEDLNVEVGEFVEVPTPTLTDNGVIITDATTDIPYSAGVTTAGTYWEVVSGPSYEQNGVIGFRPTAEGDYTIRFTGWDASGNLVESKEYTVTADYTIKPSFELENDFNTTYPWDETTDVNGKGVYAPEVENLTNGQDGYYMNVELTVEVTDKDGEEVDSVLVTSALISQIEADTSHKYYDVRESLKQNIGRYYFEVKEQGVYTVNYTAKNSVSGLETSLSEEVKVGDTTAPTIDWIDEDANLITTANIDDAFEFSLDMINIDDILGSEAVKEENNVSDYTANVYMYKDGISLEDLNETSENAYKWIFETSGNYELRIVVTDKAGNEFSDSYTITVNEEEPETNTIDPVVGTILIVVASVILVGVVTYFVVSSRKNKTTKKGPKSKK